MFGSPNNKVDMILTIYQDIRTVFKLSDIALLTGETNFQSLNKKLNYHVRTGKLQNPRKGIYAKPNYNWDELACTLYTPSYISLEYVLQKAGIIFQYDSAISVISYLSRNIEVENQTFKYRKIKNELLVNTTGILRLDNQINIATSERAFLDLLYLNTSYNFDNLIPLDKKLIYNFLPIYQSDSISKRVTKIFENDRS